MGMKGQLGKMQRMHRHGSTKNLSRQNLSDMSDMISNEMKKGVPYSKAGITRQMRKRIIHEAWQKVKTDKSFTKEDFKDLEKIVSTIQRKYRESVTKWSSARPSDPSSAGPPPNQKIPLKMIIVQG